VYTPFESPKCCTCGKYAHDTKYYFTFGWDLETEEIECLDSFGDRSKETHQKMSGFFFYYRGFHLMMDTILGHYMVLLGDNNYSNVAGTYWYSSLMVLFLLFSFISVIVMTNLLVAILSKTYADSKEFGTA
jgi:hypothetical protein